MKIACDTQRRLSYVVPTILCLGLAVMTRYEAWLLIPVWVCYCFWRSRDSVQSAGLLVVLMAFPLYWMCANYRHLDDPLPGGTMTFEGVQPVTLPVAGGMLLWKSIAHLGWLPPLLPAGIIGGALLVLVWSSKGKVSPEQILHLAMAGVLWCFLVWFVAARGDFQDRYLLPGFVIVLPFAGLLYAWLWRPPAGTSDGGDSHHRFVSALVVDLPAVDPSRAPA